MSGVNHGVFPQCKSRPASLMSHPNVCHTFLESPISSCNKGRYSVHHGSSIAVSPGHSSPCETGSPCSHGCGMLWLRGEPSLTNAASLSVSEWGSLHSLLLGSGFTISWLGVSERGILEPHHFGSILLSHLFSWCGVVPKFVEWWGLVGAADVCVTGTGTSRRCGILTPLDVKWAYVASYLWTAPPCLNCVGWQDISLTEDRASSPCLDCVGWQDMRLVSGRASSPCLNCMGWQDTSLTVAKEDRASSPYLNCIGWQDKSSSRWSFPMSGGMASSPYLNCVGWQDKLTVEVKNHNALWTASAPFECCRTDLVLVLLRHGRLVDRIEENQKK